MPLPSVEDLKVHLHIRHDAENDDLQDKLEAAIDYAAQFIDRPIPWKDDEGADVEVPKSVGLAIKIIAAEFYANREESVVGTIYTKIQKAENMLHFYRVGFGV